MKKKNQHNAMLLVFYKEWQDSERRAGLARQSLAGAEQEALVKQARFKGAAELQYGKDAQFSYDPKTGLTFK